jgi:hypothetical protein
MAGLVDRCYPVTLPPVPSARAALIFFGSRSPLPIPCCTAGTACQPRSGYGCNDHFHEPDTFEHSIEALIEIIAAANVSNPAMVVDVGLPYIHANVRYNCRCIFAGG